MVDGSQHVVANLGLPNGRPNRDAGISWLTVSRVGLVLGGGGVSGASYEMAALMAVEMATGWDPNEADVIVGTSAGSFVAGVVRAGRLELSSMVEQSDDRGDVAQRISRHMFRGARPGGVRRWLRHGLVPGLRQPGVRLILGSPGRFSAQGIRDWAGVQIGEHVGSGWPDRPTLVTAYHLEGRERVVFGSEAAPDVPFVDAVAASSAVPVIFSPHVIDGQHYVDGGVVSGTHADLVLGNPTRLDLILILAPMAAEEAREGAYFYESMFDRVGKSALDVEIAMIKQAWPDTDIVVLRPSPAVLDVMRPNPMNPDAAVPTFIKTLTSMKVKLGRSDTWAVLKAHLGDHRTVAG